MSFANKSKLEGKLLLKSSLIELLEKLNNGATFTSHDIELNYKQIKPLINLLYSVDDFPVDDYDEEIYCFIKAERKIFDKYHIQDIADIIIDYEMNVTYSDKDFSSIVIDYIENKSHNSKKIDTIVFDYTSGKSCSDSKDIKQLILENATKEKKYNEEVLTERILQYATDIKHRENIAKIITHIERHKSFSIEIQYIIKESKLPRRDDETYKIISSYEPYEMTHCISYEMAIRNKEVQTILEKIKVLTVISRELFKANMLHKNDSALFYIMEMEEQKAKLLESLDTLQIKLNIDFNTSNLTQIQSELYRLITEYTISLEEDYYMIYDREEIVPEGMEDIVKEPNHYEPDIELNHFMDKVIEQSIHSSDDPNYKDNYTEEDGYVVYQGAYDESTSYDINKIKPNFKRPMREFNQTQVAFNMSLPKNEIVAYIEQIKDDYDGKNTSYKTLNQLLYGNETKIEDTLNHKDKERYADDFFIYDYYIHSDEGHKRKLEIIQKKLSQYHGMKIEKGRNNYELINYDKAQIKMSSPKTKTDSNSLTGIVQSFKENAHTIHYLETIKIIEERYEVLKNMIDNKKYKKLIHHE